MLDAICQKHTTLKLTPPCNCEAAVEGGGAEMAELTAYDTNGEQLPTEAVND